MAKEITYYGQLRPTGVDNSTARRFEALAGLAGTVNEIAFEYGAKRAKEIGAAEGLTAGQQAAETGEAPERRKGFLSTLSIQDQAYNRAIEGSYLASMQIDVQNNINRIAAENPNDSQAFLSAVDASVRPSLDALTDPTTRAKAEQVIDVLRSQQLRQIDRNVITKKRNEDDEVFVQAITQANDLLVNAAKDKDALGVVTATQMITEQLENRLDLGTISKTEFDEDVRKVGIIAQSSAYQGEIRGMANKGQWIQGYNLIDELASKELKGYTPQEQSALIAQLRSDLSERAVLNDRVEAEQARNLADARLAKTQELFTGIMDNSIGGADIESAVRIPSTGGISIAQYNQLNTLLKSRGDATDDSSVVIAITDLIRTDPAAAQQLIIDNMGTNLSRATVKSLYTTATSNLVSDSALNTGEAKRYAAYLQDMIAPVSGYQMPGADEDSQRYAQVKVAYDARVSAGEKPAVVAKSLVDISVMMETDKDLDFQLELADRNYEQIENPSTQDKASYDEEVNRLEAKKAKLTALRGFEADLKLELEGNPEAFKQGR